MPEAIVHEGRVQLRDAQDVAHSVPEEQLGEALAGGEYRLETADEWNQRAKVRERETPGQRALTAGEGALRGATFGLGTAALAGVAGEDYRRAALERAEVNPRTAMAGELAGAIAPAFLSGGESAIGSLARLTPAAQIGRVGGAVERGVGALTRAAGVGEKTLLSSVGASALRSGAAAATEGAAYGLGSSLADAALEGRDWTAERALAGLGEGALFGLAGGALVGGGKAALAHGARRASRAVVDAMSYGGRTFKQAVSNWAEERAVGSIAKGADDAEGVLAKIGENGQAPERVQRIVEKLKAAGLETESRGEVVSTVAREGSEAAARKAQLGAELSARGAAPNGERIIGDMAEAADKLASSDSIDHVRAAERIRKLTKTVPRTVQEAEALQTKLEKVVSWARDKGAAAVPDLEKLSSRISAHIDDAAADLGPEAQGLWKAARDEAQDWKSLSQHLGREKLSDRETGKLIGLAGMLTSLATGSIVPSLAAAGIGQSAAARAFVRNRGGAAVSWLASRAGWVERATISAAKRLAGGEPLQAAVSALGSTLTPTALKEVAKRRPASPARLYPLAREDREKRFQSTAEDVRSVTSDPGVLAEKVRRAVAPVATDQPEVAYAMAQRIVGDYQYLASKLPPTASTFGDGIGVQSEPLVSRADQDKLVRYAEALANPMDAMNRIADGAIDWEAVDALKERRPDLWEGFRGRVAIELSTNAGKVSYKRRLQIGLMLDLPTDMSISPRGGGAVLDSIAPAPQSPPPNQRPAPPPNEAGKSLATPSQQALGA